VEEAVEVLELALTALVVQVEAVEVVLAELLVDHLAEVMVELILVVVEVEARIASITELAVMVVLEL
jgi:hypothetical protein